MDWLSRGVNVRRFFPGLPALLTIFLLGGNLTAQEAPLEFRLGDDQPAGDVAPVDDQWSAVQPGQADGPGMQQGSAPGDRQPAGENQDLARDDRFAGLFGEVSGIADLPESRAGRAQSPAADAVFAPEATGRKTSDVGDLLNQSRSSHGVSIQQRTPVTNETRVRGQRVGQVLASGSYWAPARMDLDTMMNKIDSRLIENAILVKGPYAARYGPGFRFVDLEFIQTPRYQNGGELHGLTGASFGSNGEHWSGRQSVWGGGFDYGFHVSYGHRTGNDYETGNGTTLPTSFKSRDLFIAWGRDLSPHESVEINALRLDQTDLEFPGLVFDLDFLITDGYEWKYRNTAPMVGDLFTTEVWYNRTRFEGDTLRPGKNLQIPTLVTDLESPGGNAGFAITDGDALSGGYRMQTTYFGCNCYGGEREISLGTDLIFLNQELNDIEPLAPANDNNFPIPRSHSVDVGVYAEKIDRISPCLTVTSGARIDGVFTDAEDVVAGVPQLISDLKDSDLDQEFLLGAAYMTGEYRLTPCWTVDLGAGASLRPPTLTELYAENSFIGSLQRGLTFLEGDPQLDSEKLLQVDFGTRYESNGTRFGAFGHFAWIHDYVTYDLVAPAGAIDGFPQGAAFVNTDMATLSGFETYGQRDLSRMLTVFGSLNFVEGRDHSRNSSSRLYAGGGRLRSDVNIDQEPLPGIAPLESRLGFLIQDPCVERRWGIEFAARIVDNQDRIATSLEEVATPGFTTFDIRTYRRWNQFLLTAGVENLGDKFYREHVDYRSGLGVFRPGVNYYVGSQLVY
ncbi:MAG: TonB-dependent receptor [Planctomycetota bacterium]